MSQLRLIAVTIAAASVAMLPAISSAQTVNTSAQTSSASSLMQNIQNLLVEIALLQKSAASTPTPNSTPTVTVPIATQSAPAPSDIICPTLVRTLALGDSGSDVANLQGFLAQNPLIYPEQTVTGYFNMFTQDAVERWQTAYGVVSSGSPATTGYGVVGPHTRTAILASCANSANGQNSTNSNSNSTSNNLCPIVPEPSVACPGTWSPITNATGCTRAWQCSFLPSQIATTTTAVTSVTTTAAPTSSACVPYTLPGCFGGTVQWLGMSANHCNLGYRCVMPGQ